jgi:dihydroorotase
MKIHIKNGRLIDPRNGIDAVRDVFIAAGKVVAVGDVPSGFGANRVIDATNRVVCPGLVDLAVRLREPGFEYLATLESEMKAAIAGGITSLACPPDTDPPLDEPGLVEMLKYRAKNLNQAHVYPIGALTTGLKGERLTEMAELRDAGCVAFSQAEAPFADNLVLLHALEYAATFDIPVWLRAQDPALARNGVAHDGEVATRLGLPAIPVAAHSDHCPRNRRAHTHRPAVVSGRRGDGARCQSTRTSSHLRYRHPSCPSVGNGYWLFRP